MFCCYPEKEYEIDGILDEKVAPDGTVMYKVKWKGYSKASWEPEQNLNALATVKAFKVKDLCETKMRVCM